MEAGASSVRWACIAFPGLATRAARSTASPFDSWRKSSSEEKRIKVAVKGSNPSCLAGQELANDLGHLQCSHVTPLQSGQCSNFQV